jgi:hypothetical protein
MQMTFDGLDDYEIDQDLAKAWRRGYLDRSTGHDPDLPLQSAERRQYRAGYEAAGAEASAALLADAGCTPRETAAYLEAERITWEFRTKSTKRLDAGKRSIEDSPLFGGERQEDLF